MHVTKNITIIWHVTWSHLKHFPMIWKEFSTDLNCVYSVWSLVRDLLKELFAEALWRNGCLSDHVGHLRSHFPIASPAPSSHCPASLPILRPESVQNFGVGLHGLNGSPPLDKMGNIHTTTTWNAICVYVLKIYIYILLYNIRRSKCTLEFMKERRVASFSSSTIKLVPQAGFLLCMHSCGRPFWPRK